MRFRQVILSYGLPVLMVVVGLYGFFSEKLLTFIPGPIGQTETISRILEKTGSSYRRYSLDTLWLPTRLGASVSNGDYLRTDSLSRVTISLSSKPDESEPLDKLEIDEDSYVRIFKNGSHFQIQLK